MLKILDKGLVFVEEQMEEDRLLLSSLEPKEEAYLRLYQFSSSSLTYGHFQAPETHLHMDQVGTLSLSLAKRPTGGGLIFHQHDLTFSLFIPSEHPRFSRNTQQNYQLVHLCVLEAIHRFSGKEAATLYQASSSSPLFCMAEPACYDVMLDGKKVAGGAQRKTKTGFLHQGSISLAPLDTQLLSQLVRSDKIFNAMKQWSGSLLTSDQEIEMKREELKRCLIQSVSALDHHMCCK